MSAVGLVRTWIDSALGQHLKNSAGKTMPPVVAAASSYLSDADIWQPVLDTTGITEAPEQRVLTTCPYTRKPFREMALRQLSAHPQAGYYVLILISSQRQYASVDALSILSKIKREGLQSISIRGNAITQVFVASVHDRMSCLRRVITIDPRQNDWVASLETMVWANRMSYEADHERAASQAARKELLLTPSIFNNDISFFHYLTLFLHHSPNDPEITLQLMNFLKKEGPTPAAAARAERMSVQFPHSFSAQSALSHFYEACLFRPDLANRAYQRMLQLAPPNSPNYLLAVKASYSSFLYTGQVHLAVPGLRLALHYHPRDSLIKARLGEALVILGQFDKAIPHLQAAQGCPEASLIVKESLIVIAFKQQRWDAVIIHTETLFHEHPAAANNLVLQRFLGLSYYNLYLNDQAADLGNFIKALEHLERAAQLGDPDLELHRALRNVHEKYERDIRPQLATQAGVADADAVDEVLSEDGQDQDADADREIAATFASLELKTFSAT